MFFNDFLYIPTLYFFPVWHVENLQEHFRDSTVKSNIFSKII